MKEEILKIAKDLQKGTITTQTARTLLLGLFGVERILPTGRKLIHDKVQQFLYLW